MSGVTMEELAQLLGNREAALKTLDKVDCEENFTEFVKHFWNVTDPARPYVDGWAMQAIDEHLMAVSKGQIRKLLMNVPPGFSKSLKTSVFWPAWEWGPRNRPDYRYVCASYSESLTIRDNLRCRLVMKSPMYQEFWGDRFAFSSEQDAKIKFANDKTGFKLATSVHGVGTGERGDRIIIDDPHNVLEAESEAKRESVLQWFTEVLPTRVNDPSRAVFVVIMQRVHEQDVSGLILSKELGYEHLCIPMHFDPNHPYAGRRKSFLGWRDPRREEGELAFPERYTPQATSEMIEAMMSWGGTYAVAGQMEQRPEPRGGGMFQRDWFEIVDELPEGFLGLCRGWDFASTEGGDGAGSASVLTGEDAQGDLYVLDCEWKRVSPGGLREMVQDAITRDTWDTFQSFPKDPGQAGVYQTEDLLDLLRGCDFEFTAETGEKEVRARPFAAQCEVRAKVGKKVKMKRAPWNSTYLDHMSKFPRGRYQDIPDAQSRSYGGLIRRGSGATAMPGGSTLVEGSN
jgi:predicted phage terminase large subunit-like protein